MKSGLNAYAHALLKRAVQRSLIAGLALFLNCILIVPFLYGHSLHAYWGSIGQCLLWLAVAMVVVFCFSWIPIYTAWEGLRDLKKGRISFK
jgi:hypothetical protein